MKTSRWKRYDARSGLWIASSKPVFAYWFRFLKHAAKDPDRQVDWSLYEPWGGKEYILHTKQNDWWKAKWKTLFGYREGGEPRYRLTTTKPQPDGIRIALMVYELHDKPLLDGSKKETGKVGDYWEIAKYIAMFDASKLTASEKEKWAFNIARYKNFIKLDDDFKRRRLPKEELDRLRKQKRVLQSRIGRYMQQAERHLDSVCEGHFP